LLDEPCFDVVRDDPRLPTEADSGLALRQWWNDGGQWWLDVSLHPQGPSGPRFVFPPRIRRTLTAETRPGHPLGPILCPAAKPDCSAEAVAWKHRAEQTLGALVVRNAVECDVTRWTGDVGDQSVFSPGECGSALESAPGSEKFGVWKECTAHEIGRHPVFPVGGPRPPRSGWLTVVGGGSLTYPSCTRAGYYDLSTGLTLRATACQEQAQAPIKRTYEAGTSSFASLSEALWMMLMLPEMGPIDRSYGFETSVPTGIAHGDDVALGGVGCQLSVSDAVVSRWRWSGDPAADVTGELTVRDDTDSATEYAETLLRVAEETYKPGCSTGRAPPVDDLLALTSWVAGAGKEDVARREAVGLRNALRNCGR
jgi:hypothetical protein